MKRWQYQIKADSLPTSGAASWKEDIKPNKWYPSFPDLRRPLAVITAAVLATAVMVTPPTVEGALWARPDKVKATYQDYHYTKPGISRSIQSGFFASEVPPVATGSWAEQINITKWMGKTVDNPVKLVTRFQHPQTAFVWKPVAAEVITPDKWIGRYPDTLFLKSGLSRAIQSGSFVIGQEIITLDKWQVEGPDNPIRLKAGLSVAIQAGSFFFFPIELTSIDKWIGSIPDIIASRVNLSRGIIAGSLSYVQVPTAAAAVAKLILLSNGHFAKKVTDDFYLVL